MISQYEVRIQDGEAKLDGVISMPRLAKALILFAHGSGSSHKSPRNIYVSNALNEAGFATLLFDLLTTDEAQDRYNVFDIPLMTRRLLVATDWAQRNYSDLTVGYFGASTGAAAALRAAQDRQDIFAVVSRGGRPDLAMDSLARVNAPTMLIVGAEDGPVIPLNQKAQAKLENSKLVLIPHATHLFEEAGALEEVVDHAVKWFSQCFDSYSVAHRPSSEKTSHWSL